MVFEICKHTDREKLIATICIIRMDGSQSKVTSTVKMKTFLCIIGVLSKKPALESTQYLSCTYSCQNEWHQNIQSYRVQTLSRFQSKLLWWTEYAYATAETWPATSLYIKAEIVTHIQANYEDLTTDWVNDINNAGSRKRIHNTPM